MLKRIKELSGHTLIYSLAWFASSCASILLLPVYTRFLSKVDYGILELLDYTNTILTFVVSAGVNQAIPKFFNETDSPEKKRQVVSTGISFVLFSGAIVGLFAFLLNDVLAQLILGDVKYTYYITLNIILLYVQLLIFVVGTGFVAAKKSKQYLSYMLVKLLLTVSCNLYFIVVLKLGVLGMLYGNILANSLVALVILAHSISLNGLKLSCPILFKLLKFGLPMIPASILATIMHNADRFLIRHYCSLDDVGLYAIGYKFPFMLNALILQSFNFIWTGSMMYEVSGQPDASYQYGRIATYVLSFYVAAQLCLSVFSISIVEILVDPKFFVAHQVTPVVALGLSFHAFYFFFSIGTFIKGKTWLLNYAYFPAALINIVGNIWLLPKYGYMAAAWVSVVTYLTFAIILFCSCRRLIRVEFEVKRLAILFAAAIFTFTFSRIIILENLFFEIMKGCAFVLLFFVILFVSGWLTRGEEKFLKEKLQRVRGNFLLR